MNYRGFKRWKSDTRTRTRTHASGRQVKITFLDVLDYSEYSDTNISKKKKFHENSFLSKEAKYEKFENRNLAFAEFKAHKIRYFNKYDSKNSDNLLQL